MEQLPLGALVVREDRHLLCPRVCLWDPFDLVVLFLLRVLDVLDNPYVLDDLWDLSLDDLKTRNSVQRVSLRKTDHLVEEEADNDWKLLRVKNWEDPEELLSVSKD